MEVPLAPLRNVLKERTNLALRAGYSRGIQYAGTYLRHGASQHLIEDSWNEASEFRCCLGAVSAGGYALCLKRTETLLSFEGRQRDN